MEAARDRRLRLVEAGAPVVEVEREVAEVEEAVEVALEFFIFLSHTCLTSFPPHIHVYLCNKRNGSFFGQWARFFGAGREKWSNF